MKITLAVLALVIPSAAFGMLFNWTDSAGIKHYTNKEYDIPVRYRAKAKHLYPEQADTPSPQQNPQTQQAAKTEGQTPTQPVAPEGQIRTQQPVAVPEFPKQEVRPAHVRRRRGTSSSSSEE